MRRYTVAAALALTSLALTGCQTQEASVDSKHLSSEDRQKEMTRLQNQWNSLLATSMADCPVNPRTGKEPSTAKCSAEAQKAHEIEGRLKQLAAEQAAE